YTTKRPSKYSNIGTLKNPPFSKKIYVIIRDPTDNQTLPAREARSARRVVRGRRRRERLAEVAKGP
ncbi:MAG: hypothetical protein, partial [Olavius algarvensis Gamma 1 endosymbiont]